MSCFTSHTAETTIIIATTGLYSCCTQSTFLDTEKYLRLALPLLFFCVLPFLLWEGGWTASFTASSQKPMLELCVSPQTLLESDPQLVEILVFIEPHTEVLRGVCEGTKSALKSNHTYNSTVLSLITGDTYSSSLSAGRLCHSGMLWLLLLPLLHLLRFFPLNLQ